MKSKFLFSSLLLLFSLDSFATPKTRKLAQQNEGSVFEVILAYGNDANNFKDIKLYLTPTDAYMSFVSYEHREYLLDCPRRPGDEGWTCFSPCDGGEIKISFSETLGFREITMAPFDIIPRLCDGSEDESDPHLTARKALKFQLKSISPRVDKLPPLKKASSSKRSKKK